MTTFAELGLTAPIPKCWPRATFVAYANSSASDPHVLAGRDLIGIAQTGTGKTAASRCRSCNGWQAMDSESRADAVAHWCWRRPASWRARSTRAFVFMAAA